MDELRETLAATPLSSLAAAEQDILSLEHNHTVADALRLLARHNVLSAPLVVSPGLEDMESMSMEAAETSPSLVGWLDVKDIIKAFLAYLHEHRPQLPVNMLALMGELEKHGPGFARKMLITIVGSEDRGLVYKTDAEVSVLAAIRDVFLGQQQQQQEAAGGSNGRARAGVVHRLAVFDAHGSITAVVSQMDMLRLLREHLAALGPVADQTLDALGLYAGPDMESEVVTLSPATPTLLAYQQLAKDGLTGAPVVSADGQLIANLSISDIRGIQPDHFGVLALPVAEFLAVKHNTSYLGYSLQSSSSAAHPFFASGPPAPGKRPTDADAADADAADADAANADAVDADAAADGAAGAAAGEAAGGEAAAAPAGEAAAAAGGGGGGGLARAGSLQQRSQGGSGGSGGGSKQQQKHHGHHHHSSRRPSSEVGLRLITCSPQATLGTVLCQMCDNHVHRVYICREQGASQHVIGVVTPTDILSLIAGRAGWLRRTLSTKSNDSAHKRNAAEGATGDAPAAAAGGAGEAAAGGGEAAAGDAHKRAKVDA